MIHRILVSGFSNNLAGTEAVIYNYVSHAPDVLSFDFLVYEDLTNYADVFQNGKNRVFTIPWKSRDTSAYYSAIKKHFRLHAKEYSCIWANMCMLSNIDVLRLGAKYEVPKRILHAHNSSQTGGNISKLLTYKNRHTYKKYVTDRWACSEEAGSFFFKGDDYRFIPNAIRIDKYRFMQKGRARERARLGVGDKELLLGTVGRLNVQKNHEWLIKLLAKMAYCGSEVKLAIAGTGELREKLLDLASALDISKRLLMVGPQSDIPSFLSALDVFVLPSLFEGLPVALIEAQANGLPCVVSQNVTKQAAFSKTCRYVSLNDETAWEKAIFESSRNDFTYDEDKALEYDIRAQAALLPQWFGF